MTRNYVKCLPRATLVLDSNSSCFVGLKTDSPITRTYSSFFPFSGLDFSCLPTKDGDWPSLMRLP